MGEKINYEAKGNVLLYKPKYTLIPESGFDINQEYSLISNNTAQV